MRTLAATTALTLLAVLGSAALAPTTAAAQDAVLADPRGDVTSPAFDITRAVVDNGEDRLTVVVRTREIAPNRVSTVVRLADPRTGETTYLVGSKASGEARRPSFERFDDGATRPARCRGLAVQHLAKRKAVRISLPQRCLGEDAGRQLVQVSTQDVQGRLIDVSPSVRVRRA